MKFNRQFVLGAALTMLLTATYTTAKAKNYVVPKAYLFGFAASFNDSTVYFTDIQQVDSVWFTQKKDMLAGRSDYSGQLRSYCADKLDQPRRTCVVIGYTKLKKAEKKFEKMKKMYLENKKATYDVHFIKEEDFKFKAVNMNNETEESVAKPEKKKDKPKKDGKRPPRDGKMPPPQHK
jgi:hypothetical protein